MYIYCIKRCSKEKPRYKRERKRDSRFLGLYNIFPTTTHLSLTRQGGTLCSRSPNKNINCPALTSTDIFFYTSSVPSAYLKPTSLNETFPFALGKFLANGCSFMLWSFSIILKTLSAAAEALAKLLTIIPTLLIGKLRIWKY